MEGFVIAIVKALLFGEFTQPSFRELSLLKSQPILVNTLYKNPDSEKTWLCFAHSYALNKVNNL